MDPLLFGMGCHGFPGDSGAWTGVARSDMVYRVCGAGSMPMGDEKHLVLIALIVRRVSLLKLDTFSRSVWGSNHGTGLLAG